MLAEVERFAKWLRRRSPHATTPIHYTNDLQLFFAWLDKPPAQVTVRDVDRFIEHSQAAGHAIATINRRVAALRSFYQFWQLDSADAPSNPVLPKRHFIRQGTRLPRDVEDATLQKLFAVITDTRDRAMFVLMLRCGLRVGEVRNLSLTDLYLEPTPGNLPRLRAAGSRRTLRVAESLAQYVPLVQQVIAQTTQRVLEGHPVAAGDKLVSLFEPHTAIIQRGKSAPNETEFGRKL